MSKKMSRKELQEAVVFIWKYMEKEEELQAYFKMSKEAQAEFGKFPRLPLIPQAYYEALREWSE
jgi:hypothetical protein